MTPIQARRKLLQELFSRHDQPPATIDRSMFHWQDPVRGMVVIVLEMTGEAIQKAYDTCLLSGVKTVVIVPGQSYKITQPIVMHGEGVSIICPRSMDITDGHINIEWWTAETWQVEIDKYTLKSRLEMMRLYGLLT